MHEEKLTIRNSIIASVENWKKTATVKQFYKKLACYTC